MSTITTASRPLVPSPSSHAPDVGQGDYRIVIPGVGWHVYDCLDEAIGEGLHIRLAYDGKDLEIIAVGRPHGRRKELLGYIVGTVSKLLGIPRQKLGETTWKRLGIERGIQADQSYYFDAAKLAAANAADARGSDDIDDYPDPDLVIEVDLSRPQIDRPGIYAKLQVPEIWRFTGTSLVIEQLQDDGTYLAVGASRFLPLRTEDVLHWLIDEDWTDETAWERRVDEWAMRLARGPDQQ